MLHSKSLAMKLILFTGATLLLVIGTTLVFSAANSTAMRKEAARITDAYFTHINDQVISSLADNSQLVEIFAVNADVQNYLSSQNPAEKYKSFLNINSLYTTALGIKSGFRDLIVIDGYGQGLSVGGLLYDFNKVENYYHSLKNLEEAVVSVCDFSPVYQSGLNNCLVSACPVYKNIGYRRQQVGGLLFIMDLQPVMDTMDAIKFTPSSHTLLFSEAGVLLCGTSGSELLQQQWLDDKSFSDDSKKIKLGSTTYMCFTNHYEKADFFLMSFVPMNEVYVYSTDYTKNTIILILVNAIAIVFMALYINRSFRRPVQSLLASMEAVKKGDLSSRARIIEESEIGVLANSFDEMMSKIQAMTKTIVENQARMYELELMGSRMELKALQSQINPHFLYNTLACIQSIAICNNEEEILKITKALSNMYRYILRVPDVVSLKEEVDNIQNYLIIQKIRMGERLCVKFDVSFEVVNQQILKLLLQPIVENAIEHGIGEKVGNGEVVLTIKRNAEHSRLDITVSDDGVGMDEKTLSQIRGWAVQKIAPERDHVGVKSVVSRMRLAYHEDFTFACTSQKGRGTEFFLSVPYVEDPLSITAGTTLFKEDEKWEGC